MAYRKTAITVPESVLVDVDRAARLRGESRSKYITNVLRAAVRAQRDAEITRRLDELFAAEELTLAQREEAARVDEVGTDWTDERW
jgi:metal-responsive CopG/Arc/MetJ family transcriptional regulator